jgi:hypothetical protein
MWTPGLARRGSGDPWWTAGERFYQTGETIDGTAVDAMVQGDLRVRSTDMPCANCHRRSGWAGSEGSVAVPPVTSVGLFAPVSRGVAEMGTVRTTGAGTRPAYDDTTLLRAIREGLDPSGRRLSPTMPRYSLGDADGAALIAHLRTLAAVPPAGVTGTDVHLATVITPGVSGALRRAMLDVLRAYVRDRNAGTRQETRRRERGPWDMKKHYDAYRNWTLHEWTLTGPPGEWAGQLATLYREQPVFALLGGISDDDWSPVHEFAERFRVPVVLPQTPLAPDVPASAGFYTLYFSRGVAVEAETLVEHLSGASVPVILQVARCHGPGLAAARRVRDRLAAAATVTTVCIGDDVPLTLDAGAVPSGATVALWLDAADVRRVAAMVPASAPVVYLSSTLLGAGLDGPLPAFGRDTRLLHPFVPPDELDRHAWRALAWLQAKGLSTTPRQVAVNALVAAQVAADSLGRPRALDSREYFIEGIESMASRLPGRSAYPEMLFGVQRRVGSAGCYVLQVPATPDGAFRKVGAWTVPRS